MDMYDSVFSPSSVLSEQVARQIFEILPENGPIIVILDKDGNSWPSNSEEYTRLNLSASYLKELCGKINDGHEPVVTQVEQCTIIGAQLATKKTNCGYVIIIIPQYNPESALVNIDLIEIVINQVNLIARLVEKNNLLYELQMRQHSLSGDLEQGSSVFN